MPAPKLLRRHCTRAYMGRIDASSKALNLHKKEDDRREQMRARELQHNSASYPPCVFPPIRSASSLEPDGEASARPKGGGFARLDWQPHKGDAERDPDVVKAMRDTGFTRSIRIRVAAAADKQVDSLQVEMERISEKTGLPIRKVEELYRVFNPSGKKGKVLDPSSFVKVMSDFGIEDSLILERLYTVFDEGGDHCMEFSEFVDCCAVFLIGDRRAQADVLFKMINVSGDGTMSKIEMLRFFAGNAEEKERKRIIGALVSELMVLLDEDGSGEVEYGEWIDQVVNEDSVWDVFCAISPLTVFVDRVKKAGKYVLPY